MPTLNYAAPTTVDEAVKLLAGASGLAKVLSGGTDLLVQMRSGRLKPDLIVDTKKIPGIIGIREESGGFVIGAATPGVMVEAQPAEPGLARHRRGARSDRLDADPGPRLARRQSVQRLAGRRQRAGAVSPPARSPSSPAARAGARCRSSRSSPARAAPRSPRASSSSSSSSRRGQPRSGDAYLRFIPRTEMDIAVVGVRRQRDAGRQRRLHRRARRARRGGADRAAGEGRGRGADRPQARRRYAGEARCGGARGLQADQRQARHDRIPHQGRRRARTPRGRHRLRTRPGKAQGKTH